MYYVSDVYNVLMYYVSDVSNVLMYYVSDVYCIISIESLPAVVLERIPAGQEEQPRTGDPSGLPLQLRTSARRSDNASTKSKCSNFLRVHQCQPETADKTF